MQDSTIFREKIATPDEPEQTAAEMEKAILQNDDIQGATKASEETDEPKERTNALENWEMEHGKYGVELFGIKEVVKEFPYGMQFGALDNYIKAEIKEKGLEPSPKTYMKILAELEAETGTKDAETLTKMKKLYDYIQIVKKFNELKKKKEMFR